MEDQEIKKLLISAIDKCLADKESSATEKLSALVAALEFLIKFN